MKKLKKLAALLLAVVMTMAMNMTVFAADTTTYSLTLTGTKTGHTYDAYQIFTGDLSTNTDGDKVLSNVQWGTGITYTGAEKSAADVADKLVAGTLKLDTLESELTLNTPVKEVSSSADNTVIGGLVAGYYLVKDKDGTQDSKSDAYTKFIVQVVGDTSTKVKSDVPTVEKKVKDTNDSTGVTSDWQDSADYDIGDDVPFQITGTMPSNIDDYTKYAYTFTDTMSAGLTYTTKTATIKIGDTDVTSSFTETVDGQKVTWACADLKAISGVTLTKDTKVVVTYSATLNEKAVTGSAGNPNTVYLTYSNNPNEGGEGTGKTPEDKNVVFTYKTVVNKVDQDQKSLAGAGFTLQKKVNGTYTDVKTFTAGMDTTFTFTGLDDGDYKLIESTTPAGYNTIDDVEFTISATHDTTEDDPKLLTLSGDVTSGTATFAPDKTAGSLTTQIVNKKGSVLPSTGGIGTRMFYVFGGCLVAAAVVLLALKKRREA